MASRAKQLVESWTYTPRADRELPLPDRSSFRLRPMTQAELAVALDDVSVTVIEPDGSKIIATREHQVALRLCRQHILSAENFPAGAAEAWPNSRVEKDRFLAMMEMDLISEIGDEIFTRSSIGELEKNS